MSWRRAPLEVDVEGANVAVVTVLPGFAIGTLVEASETSTEVSFGWFCLLKSSSGCSNRPRSKDMIVMALAVVVCGLTVDIDVVKC